MGVGVDLLCFVAIDIVLNTGLSCLLHRVFYDLFEGCVVEGVRVCLCCCSELKEGLGTNKQTNKQLNTPRTMAVGSRPYPWASTFIPAPSAA